MILMLKQQRVDYNATSVERLPSYYNDEEGGVEDNNSMNQFDYVVIPRLPEIDPPQMAKNLTAKQNSRPAEKVS